ncbi:MAG: hypothetical protein LQ342_006478 [Letrouitia transgressa]|nr:MAG: hypothetical protein LQ342_006478 [Letrouitia transgressa]
MAGIVREKSIYCRTCLGKIPCVRTFTFSAARQRHGAVPTFSSTSSQELDNILATFRSKVFLPAHLSREQQSILYRKKNINLLTSEDEPATVKIANETHRLLPLDHKEEPQTRSSLNRMLELMKEGRDWVNLPAFLENLWLSKRKIKDWQMVKIVRRASDNGNQGIILECLRRMEKTGMVLADLEVARAVMWGGMKKCMQTDWTEQGLEAAEKYLNSVWNLMEDERHVKKEIQRTKNDPRMRPEIVGVMLQVQAVRRAFYGEGVERGSVQQSAEILLASWDNMEADIDELDWNDANRKLMMWVPVWHGIKMAVGLLGESPLRMKLENKMTKDLEPKIQKAREVVLAYAPQPEKRLGLSVYEALLSVESQKP